jgi:hypothetical protein
MLKTILTPSNFPLITWIVGATLTLYTAIWLGLGLNQLVEQLNDIF